MTVQRIREVGPPTGLLRLVARAPVWLYRGRLGGLLGGRFLLLTHTGRRTGLARQAVLEVVDRDPETGGWLVASGYGRRSDWLRNITAHPHVEVRSGWRPTVKATARRLSPHESGSAMAAVPNSAQRRCRRWQASV
jgi:deazaflavin-dependent oxidoreductase (nitroreductase family)